MKREKEEDEEDPEKKALSGRGQVLGQTVVEQRDGRGERNGDYVNMCDEREGRVRDGTN